MQFIMCGLYKSQAMIKLRFHTMAGTFLSALSLILLVTITRINAQEPWEGGLWELPADNADQNPYDDPDPLVGVYVGEYGSHGKEIVQLRRKTGAWNTGNPDFSDEYVEALKITGDPNVPAGQVSFRAKLGKVTRNDANWAAYPQELALPSYVGQGRIADTGFRNPRWVEGVLLQLNRTLKGADLAFLWLIPGQSPFVVLFNRLS